jgi:hypothetical protein
MNVNLQIRRNGSLVYEHVYDICDADSFGRACADAWTQLREQRLAQATSIGALYDTLNDEWLDGLLGAEIRLSKVTDKN